MLQGNNMLNKYKFRRLNIQRLKDEICIARYKII